MRVDPVFAHFRKAPPNELARKLGLRWVHGLIDLTRYSRGETYYELRDKDWNESFGVGSATEDALRIALLESVEHATRVQMRTNEIEGMDIKGVADVLGVPERAIKDVLAALLLEGLIEEEAGTFGHGATEGACRITTEGARELRALRRQPRPQITSGRAVRAVLLTDIVGSTARAAEVGDEAWQSVLKEHYRISEELVDQFGGRLVKRTGDGILALFELPTSALICALGLRSRLGGIGVRIRAGIHAGEIDVSNEDVTGIAVHVAARLLEESDGFILTTEVVRELAAGSGLEFTDFGEQTLRDVLGGWRLFAVGTTGGEAVTHGSHNPAAVTHRSHDSERERRLNELLDQVLELKDAAFEAHEQGARWSNRMANAGRRIDTLLKQLPDERFPPQVAEYGRGRPNQVINMWQLVYSVVQESLVRGRLG